MVGRNVFFAVERVLSGFVILPCTVALHAWSKRFLCLVSVWPVWRLGGLSSSLSSMPFDATSTSMSTPEIRPHRSIPSLVPQLPRGVCRRRSPPPTPTLPVGSVGAVAGHVGPPPTADHHEEQADREHVGQDEGQRLVHQPFAPEHGRGAAHRHVLRDPLRERRRR